MIHLDTNFLIAALVSGSPQDRRLREWLAAGEQVGLSVLAWGEFLCGPAAPDQITLAGQLFPQPEPLTATHAFRAAELFNASGRRRGTFIDCLIAATAIQLDVPLATQNIDEFRRFEPSGLRILSA